MKTKTSTARRGARQRSARPDYRATDWQSFPMDAKAGDPVSEHFKFYELTRSELADRQGIPNRFPGERELHAAVYLSRRVLEPIRQEFGPFTPNSVYRSQELERALKNKPWNWVSSSQHTTGCACDVEIVGKPTLELAEWCRDHLAEYDQIICECYDPRRGPNSGWVHIALRPPGYGENRRQLLSYVRDTDSERYVYVMGLTAATA